MRAVCLECLKTLIRTQQVRDYKIDIPSNGQNSKPQTKKTYKKV